MQIQDKGRLAPAFHIENGLGRSLVASGTHVEIQSAKAAPQPSNTTWEIAPASNGYPPMLVATCATCAAQMLGHGPNIARVMTVAHKPSCSGGIQHAPDDIAKRYRDAFTAWAPEKRKQKPAPMSALMHMIRSGQMTNIGKTE